VVSLRVTTRVALLIALRVIGLVNLVFLVRCGVKTSGLMAFF